MDIELLNIPVKLVLVYVVVLARVAGLVSFAPFWNVMTVPKQIRIVLAISLAIVITLLVKEKFPTPPQEYLSLAIVIIGEVIIGCLIGFIGQLVVSALDTTAQILSTQLGFSLASIINPTNRTQSSAIGILSEMLAIVVLLAINGHHWFLVAVVNSFSSFIPGQISLSQDIFYLLIRLSANALTTGVALAAPAVIILFAVEIFIALSGRVAPQLQVMLISFPIKTMIGLLLIGTSLYMLPKYLKQMLSVISFVLKQIFETVII